MRGWTGYFALRAVDWVSTVVEAPLQRLLRQQSDGLGADHDGVTSAITKPERGMAGRRWKSIRKSCEGT